MSETEKLKVTRCSMVLEMDVDVYVQNMIDVEMHIFEGYLARELKNAENEKEYEGYLLLQKLAKLAAQYSGILKKVRLSKKLQLEIGFPCFAKLCNFKESLELEF